jgi:GTP-binding protein HflX
MHISQDSKPLKALLVAVQLPKVSDKEVDESLAELARLVTTLGYEVVSKLSQKRSSEKSANVVGDGKLQIIAQWTGGTGKVAPMVEKKKHKAALRFNSDNDLSPLDIENESETDSDQIISPESQLDSNNDHAGTAQVVIFDCDLSPSQLRNLESAAGVTVLDRTGVIIEIFSRHARTRASKLQVEIARLIYVAPRLRETGGNEVQQGGGGKGAGETSLELDRRKIRDRIKELKENLSAIESEQLHRRTRREQELTVALVG